MSRRDSEDSEDSEDKGDKGDKEDKGEKAHGAMPDHFHCSNFGQLDLIAINPVDIRLWISK